MGVDDQRFRSKQALGDSDQAVDQCPQRLHRLGRDADPNLTDSNGRTALIYAVESGRSDLIQVLLQKGASANSRDNEGKTALIYAVLCGQLDVLRQHLLEVADVNAPDNESQTPLMFAAAGGSEQMVQMLLDAGADTRATTWSLYLTRYNSLRLPRTVSEVDPPKLSSPLNALEIAKRTGQNAIVAVRDLEDGGVNSSLGSGSSILLGATTTTGVLELGTAEAFGADFAAGFDDALTADWTGLAGF